jgi:hypothetical protein
MNISYINLTQHDIKWVIHYKIHCKKINIFDEKLSVFQNIYRSRIL